MLRIVKSSEPMAVERINMCIYSPPGLGKSTLAFTAKGPLLLDCDGGAYRAHNRRDTVPVTSWKDIAGITGEDLKPYKTVILDTAGRALDYLTADIISANPKMGRGGALTLQGYGELKAKFTSWLKMLKTFGKDVVLIAHMDEQRNGDDVIERLDVQGGSKGEIYKSVDAMGRIFIRNGERFLDFNPRENSFGKNPCELPVMPISLTNTAFLSDLVDTIKDRLNQSVQKSKDEERVLLDWTTAINDCTDARDLNGLLPEIKQAPTAVRFIAQRRAKELNLTYNKTLGIYEDSKQAVGAR